jgi:hypothetical protein
MREGEWVTHVLAVAMLLAPLSPLLANLVLEHLDDRLRLAGFPVVRYGDDLTVLPAASRLGRRRGWRRRRWRRSGWGWVARTRR